MFKFKMLTKLLVAVFVLGQLIESNLNLGIAMSIDLDALNSNSSSITLQKTLAASTISIADQPDGSELASASCASTSTETILTITKAYEDSSRRSEEQTDAGPIANPLNLVQTIESTGKMNYFGKILVGEQQTPFMVLFDLSSTAFWLPSSDCDSFQCIGRQKYNKTQSGSHTEDGRVANVSYTANVHGAQVSTQLLRDKITLAGYTINDQLFGEALHMDGEPFAYLPVDGFLGLGFKNLPASASDSSSQADETPFERLYRDGLLSEPIFSLLIKNQPDEWGYSPDSGELIFGKLAEGYQMSDLTYVPVTHSGYWEFHLDSVSIRHSIGSSEVERGCESACPAILDTGSPFISGHFTDVDRINKAMGGWPVSDSLYRLSECDLALLPDLIFNIGGVEFPLKPEEYVTVNEVAGTVVSCYSNLRVVEAEQYPFWILGELFLKRHYIVFDYGQKRLGFAKTKEEVEDSEEDVRNRNARRKRRISL